MFKKIIILCLVIFAASCSNRYEKFTYKNNSVLKNLSQNNIRNDSIIITKISYNNLMKDQMYKEYWSLLGTGWINTKSSNNIGDLIYIKESDNKFDAYDIKSGSYALGNVGNIAMVDRGDLVFTQFHYPLMALVEELKVGDIWIKDNYLFNEKNGILSASFSANPNEIVYIGDINIKIYPRYYSLLNDNIHIEIVDNYDEAERSFRKNYPQFKNKKITKRLIKLGTIFNDTGTASFFTSRLSVIRGFK